MRDWRQEHGDTIKAFLSFLNENSADYILKGGTALLVCYGLDRFSEDIDLDWNGKKNTSIADIVAAFCDDKGYSYRVAKDTETVKRYMINYGEEGRPLKVEISYRRKEISNSEFELRNGALVYNINSIAIMKTNAYTGRDKIRDLFDLSFICNNYNDQLSPETVALMRTAVEYKGIEQIDYILNEQKDELIDEGRLISSFLEMHDRLGLLASKEEKHLMQTTNHTKKLEFSLEEVVSETKKDASNINASVERALEDVIGKAPVP